MPRGVDWGAMPAAVADLPFAFGAVRVAALTAVEGRPDAGLASRNAGDVARARRAIGDSVALARRLGVPRVILEPGQVPIASGVEGPFDLGDPTVAWSEGALARQAGARKRGWEASLDAACRNLFELVREFEDVMFCLTPTRHVLGLGTPEGLQAIFDDLSRFRIGYWHDTCIAARRNLRLGEEQGSWLEPFAARMAGITLSDAETGHLYLPPGAGSVDFPLVANYIARTAGFGNEPPTKVIELDPAVDAAEIQGVHAFLTKFGL